MIVEERIYTLVPGAAQEFLTLYEQEGMPVQLRYLDKMVGYYRTEVGQLNQIVHLWGHDSFEQRAINRDNMRADPAFQAYWARVKNLIVKQESRILLPAAFFRERLAEWVG